MIDRRHPASSEGGEDPGLEHGVRDDESVLCVVLSHWKFDAELSAGGTQRWRGRIEAIGRVRVGLLQARTNDDGAAAWMDQFDDAVLDLARKTQQWRVLLDDCG